MPVAHQFNFKLFYLSYAPRLGYTEQKHSSFPTYPSARPVNVHLIKVNGKYSIIDVGSPVIEL